VAANRPHVVERRVEMDLVEALVTREQSASQPKSSHGKHNSQVGTTARIPPFEDGAIDRPGFFI